MEALKANHHRVQNLTPLEIWAFIVGRVLVAFGAGILAVKYFPAFALSLGIPALVVGAVVLMIAAKGLVRRPVSKTSPMGCRLTNRWSGRVRDKVPSPYIGVRAAQLNR